MPQNVKRAFEVEELSGTHMMVTHSYDKERKELVKKEIEVPNGYMVYFPRGHSIRCSEAEMKRLGFLNRSGLVDMDTGDLVEEINVESLKDAVSRNTRRPREVFIGSN